MAVVSDIEIRLRADIARLQQDMTAVRGSVNRAMNDVSNAAGRAKAALAGVLAGVGLGQLATMADSYAKFTSQLKLASLSAREYAAGLEDVKRIAAQSTQGLQETGVLYARIANGTRELGTAQKQVAAITETVNLSLLVSGATASEAASAQLQLSQAFASGTLRGEEFNAVNEAAPRLMLALADGIGVPVGALKKMAEEGALTSKILSDTLPNALVKLREEAKEVQTIAGAFTVLKNNVMEFVGTQAQANGVAGTLARALGLLSNNLGLLAGAVVTFTAAKIAATLAGWATGAYATAAANRALATSTLASAVTSTRAAATIASAKLAEAQAATVATAAAAALSAARVAELRTAVMAATGEVQLAIATNGLIPAQARAAALAQAHAVALSAQAVAGNAATTTAIAATAALTAQAAATTVAARAMGILRAAVAFLGGPIGAVVTLLGLAATAWVVWGNKAKEASDKAAASVDETTTEMIGRLDKQIEKLKERNRLQEAEPRLKGVGDLSDADKDGLARAKAALDAARNGTGSFTGQSAATRQLAEIDLADKYETALKRVGQAHDEVKRAADRGRTAELADWYAKNGTAAQKLAAELGELRKKFGEIPPEMEKLVRARYADKGEGKAAATAIAKEATAYQNLIASIKEKIGANALELSGYSTLSESQKLSIKLDAEIATSKTKLSAKSIAGARAEIAVLAAQEDALKTMVLTQEMRAAAVADAAKADADFYSTLRGTTTAIDRQIAAMREQIAAYGLTEAAVVDLALAKAEAALAAGPASYAELVALDQQIEKLKELRALAGDKAALDAAKAVADEQTKAWAGFEKTARDTFVSIADGGKSAAQRIKDTFKNVFFDWLYQQTVKKWIVNVEAKTTGSGGTGAGFLNNLMGGLSGANGAAGLGAVIGKGAASVLGPSISGALSSGLGALATAAPWIAGAMAVVNIAKKAFGRGPKEITATTLNGTLGDSFSGTQDSAWTKKGGWLRSNKSGVDKAAVDAMTASGLTAAYSAIKDASTAYAEVLGLNAASIATRTQAISVALGKDEAANQKAIADFFAGVADTIAGELLPDLAKFAAQGEAASATLQRLAGNFQVVDAVLIALGATSQEAFGLVGTASIEARERLIALAGGVDALAVQVDFFTENFLTEAQKIAPVQKLVAEQLGKLGLSGITTAEQFRDAVLDLAATGQLATEQGAGLLALAPAFKQLTDYLSEMEGATKAAAAAAKEAADAIAHDLVDSLRNVAGDALNRLKTSVDESKATIQNSFDSLMDMLDKRIGVSTGRVSALKSLQSLLNGARGTAPAQADIARQQAQAQIGAALAIARAGGVLPEASALEDALRAVGGDAMNQFASLVDFQRDQLRTANQIEELAALTDGQLTVEQRMLEVLWAQKAAAEKALSAELSRLDMIVTSAQMQLNAVNGVNTSVLSLKDAFASFATAISGALSNSTIAGQASVTPAVQIEALYNSLLGRASDPGGLQFYLDALKAGTSLARIEQGFKESPEYLKQQSGIYTTQQTGTMQGEGTAMLAELQTMNRRMENVERNTGQFADQFDTVSAGGNALLIEAPG